jgi:hypothetical protein
MKSFLNPIIDDIRKKKMGTSVFIGRFDVYPTKRETQLLKTQNTPSTK